jgi:3-oxoacyl-[acyl-carrier protein] reductase
MKQLCSVMVTGSSRGLGRSIAEHFLSKGFQVIGCSRQQSDLSHTNYKHFYLDVSRESDVKSMFKEAALWCAPIGLLINNAGISQSSLGVLTSGEVAAGILEANLLGNFLVTREALKIMQRKKFGRVINFSSINIPLQSVGSSLYNASKAGIDAMSKVLVRECGRADITINTLGLSLVENSGMLDGLTPKAIAEKQDGLVKPMTLNLSEIIHVIEFLTSPLAKNITGQTIYFGGV